jgi:sugar phosphate isomerase/epimerase
MPATKDPKLLYGVQIAGVGQEGVRDLPRLLRALQHIGFTEVELHSIVYDHPAATLRRMIEDAGLRSPAGHFSLLDIEKSIDYARELCLAYMVAMLPRPRPKSLHQYRAIAARLNEAGASVRGHGMEFALLFHNHELMPQQGSSGFAELMEHTDAALDRAGWAGPSLLPGKIQGAGKASSPQGPPCRLPHQLYNRRRLRSFD